MLELKETATAELTTYCTCEVWDEETDTYSPADTCSDYCFSDAEEWAGELVQDWLDSQDLNEWEQVIIQGTGLGWRSLSGFKLVKPEPLEIVRALYLNGDFTITYSLTPEGNLTARRGSHDEPMGAGFEFAKIQVCAWSECNDTEGLESDSYGQPACEYHRELAKVN
jgi:hypothetical protein